MRMSITARQASYAFLCATPFLTTVLVGMRALRVPGIYQSIGALVFALIAVAAWMLGVHAIRSNEESVRRLAVAGTLLILPQMLTGLLWVGLATPWDATPGENEMRYLVLLANGVAVTGGFVLLRDALIDAGECLYSALGFCAGLLAGVAYLFWTCFLAGTYMLKLRDGQLSPAVIALNDILDVLLFAAPVLTYLATAAFAASLRQVGWIGRPATIVYLALVVTALTLIVMRGLSYPNPTTSSAPWYAMPAFIAGIPAVPWIIPFFFGVTLLRRAGIERRI